MDTKTLLRLLKEHKVRFVVIGATSGVAHGFVRLTKDIDILVEPTRENMSRVFDALRAFGYDLSDTNIEEALEKKLLFRGYILRTDIHPSVKGVDFDVIWEHKVEYTFQGEKAYFASLDDLITMKEAAGRPQDIEDLRHLREIKRQLSKK